MQTFAQLCPNRMEVEYLQAAIPEPFKIFGRRLSPFTLGHELFLQRFGSAYSTKQKAVPTIEELTLAAFFCFRPYDALVKQFNAETLIPRFKLWTRLLRFKKIDWQEKHAAFYVYLNHYRKTPEIIKKSKGESITGAPWEQMLKVDLMKNLHQSEAAVLSTPYCLAVWNYLTFYEGEQAVQIVEDGGTAELVQEGKDLQQSIIEEACRLI